MLHELSETRYKLPRLVRTIQKERSSGSVGEYLLGSTATGTWHLGERRTWPAQQPINFLISRRFSARSRCSVATSGSSGRQDAGNRRTGEPGPNAVMVWGCVASEDSEGEERADRIQDIVEWISEEPFSSTIELSASCHKSIL